MKEEIRLVRLLAKKTDERGYTTYVFGCLEKEYNDSEYIMCTRFPNWNCGIICIGDEGYLSFKEVHQGDTYHSVATDNDEVYRYDCIHFINFVLEVKQDTDGLCQLKI